MGLKDKMCYRKRSIIPSEVQLVYDAVLEYEEPNAQ